MLAPHPSGQWLATAGYAVFLPNPRGGVGHGRDFAAMVARSVGGSEWTDIISGIDLLIAEGVADPDRLGIAGASHGGFMAAWAIGQTDRFKAAMMAAGVVDWGMLVASGDGGTLEAELSGSYGWEGTGPHPHDQVSPISFASKIRTPVLIVNGEDDTNVPVSQAIYFHRALSWYGAEHELVIYPREGHGFAERNHQLDLLRRTRAWFDRWLREEAPDGRGSMGSSDLRTSRRNPTQLGRSDMAATTGVTATRGVTATTAVVSAEAAVVPAVAIVPAAMGMAVMTTVKRAMVIAPPGVGVPYPADEVALPAPPCFQPAGGELCCPDRRGRLTARVFWHKVPGRQRGRQSEDHRVGGESRQRLDVARCREGPQVAPELLDLREQFLTEAGPAAGILVLPAALPSGESESPRYPGVQPSGIERIAYDPDPHLVENGSHRERHVLQAEGCLISEEALHNRLLVAQQVLLRGWQDG